MLPFYPKFGAAEDAPGYGPSASDDKCETCAHYRNLGQRGYCEKFSFLAEPEYSCDDYRAAGVVKESQADESPFSSIFSVPSQASSAATDAASRKASAIKRIADDAYRLELTKAMTRAQNEGLLPQKATKITSIFLPKASPDE